MAVAGGDAGRRKVLNNFTELVISYLHLCLTIFMKKKRHRRNFFLFKLKTFDVYNVYIRKLKLSINYSD